MSRGFLTLRYIIQFVRLFIDITHEIGKTPILAKSDKARLALQFVGAFVLLVIGVGISLKNTTETNEDSVSSEISVTTPTTVKFISKPKL